MSVAEVSSITRDVPPRRLPAVQAADQTSDITDTPAPLPSEPNTIATMDESSTEAQAGAARTALLAQTLRKSSAAAASSDPESGDKPNVGEGKSDDPSLEAPKALSPSVLNPPFQSLGIDDTPLPDPSDMPKVGNVTFASGMTSVAISNVTIGSLEAEDGTTSSDRMMPVTPVSSSGSATSTDIGSGSSDLKNAQSAYAFQATGPDIEVPSGEYL